MRFDPLDCTRRLSAPHFGLFGPVTEGAYLLTPQAEANLRSQVMQVVHSPAFLRKSGLSRNTRCRDTFYGLLESAQFVGSTAGGAAGYLRLAKGVPRGSDNPLVLRFALQTTNGPGNLWGLIPMEVAMRHELLHFVREAETVSHGGKSLFSAEHHGSFLSRLLLMLKEETIVWSRTLIW
jgi:hypothetical protein